MIAVAKRALLPALCWAAVLSERRAGGQQRLLDRAATDRPRRQRRQVNTGATETLSGGAAPEPLTPKTRLLRNGQYATRRRPRRKHRSWRRPCGTGSSARAALSRSTPRLGIDTVVAVYRATGAQPRHHVPQLRGRHRSARAARPDSELRPRQNGAGYLPGGRRRLHQRVAPTEGRSTSSRSRRLAKRRRPRPRCCPRAGRPDLCGRPGATTASADHALRRGVRIRAPCGSATPHPAPGRRPSTRTAPSTAARRVPRTRRGWGATTTAPRACRAVRLTHGVTAATTSCRSARSASRRTRSTATSARGELHGDPKPPPPPPPDRDPDGNPGQRRDRSPRQRAARRPIPTARAASTRILIRIRTATLSRATSVPRRTQRAAMPTRTGALIRGSSRRACPSRRGRQRPASGFARSRHCPPRARVLGALRKKCRFAKTV